MRLRVDFESDPPGEPGRHGARWIRLLVGWLTLILLIFVGNVVFEISLIDALNGR